MSLYNSFLGIARLTARTRIVKLGRILLAGILPVTLSISSTSLFAQSSLSEKKITLVTGLTYQLDSENTGSYQSKDRVISMPLSVSVNFTPSISASVRTSLVRDSAELISSNNITSEYLSGVGSTWLSLAYQHSQKSPSKWPTFAVNTAVEVLASEVGETSETSDESRSASIDLGLKWSMLSINGSVELPVGSVGFVDASESEVGALLSAASIGFKLEKRFVPLIFSASADIAYESDFEFEDVTVTPSRIVDLGFDTSFYVNEEVSFSSSVGAFFENDVQINGTKIDATGSEGLSLGLGLGYRISSAHSLSSNLTIGIDEAGRSSALSVSYSRKL